MKIVKSIISFAVIMLASIFLSIIAGAMCLLVFNDINLFFSVVIFGSVIISMWIMNWCQ